MTLPASLIAVNSGSPIHSPSESQRRAIEAPPGSLLVLAGPGAGKTYCLTERIRHLIEAHKFSASRICAFTFTNKAASEITQRLEARLGDTASLIKGGTIHAFCVELLRKHGQHIGLDAGFGIADEEYQVSVLRRVGMRKGQKSALTAFAALRFRDEDPGADYLTYFDKYERFLAKRNVLDFDMLVLRAAQLMEKEEVAREIRSQWDVVLVDEFQDLNRVQYRVVRSLAASHRHVFAVGDDEQSIYSWAGADPKVFRLFLNDFLKGNPCNLEENHRCPHDVFALARRLVVLNESILGERRSPRTQHGTEFPVRVLAFASDEQEAAWLVNDVATDREQYGHRWGEIALLYRTHEIGHRLETAFLNAGIPCRLSRGRALSEDPVVAYVLAAARVITTPTDDVSRQHFFKLMLPVALLDEALAKARENRISLQRQLYRMRADLPKGDARRRYIARAIAYWRNLRVHSRQQTNISGLIQELLSHRVGRVPSVLDEHHDEISDPANSTEVRALADKLRRARHLGLTIWLSPMRGMDIALLGMLRAAGFSAVRAAVPPESPFLPIARDDTSALDPLTVFKALQLVEMDAGAPSFRSFTTIDIETTSLDVRSAEVIEIAAFRVRDGIVVDEFKALVKPLGEVSAAATKVHHIRKEDLENAPSFADMWPEFVKFCGDDIVLAHNGHNFDFLVLERLARENGLEFASSRLDTLTMARDLVPTSKKLSDLARHFSVELKQAHRAADDAHALVYVYLGLEKTKEIRGRKTASARLLDHLGVALAAQKRASALSEEAEKFLGFAGVYALGPYTRCLEFYEHELGEDESAPTLDEIVEELGGVKMMLRLRIEKTAQDRYPSVLLRLGRVVNQLPQNVPLREQLQTFLERVVLSRYDGHELERDRVNLLTLHSTKGLEFSRVFIVGAEDGQLLSGSPRRPATKEEIEEARRLLYVGMTRTRDRLTFTRVNRRGDRDSGGNQFLDEMGLKPEPVL